MPASPLLTLARSNPDAAREQILAALDRHGGNRSHASADLGVNRNLFARCAELCGALPAMAERWPDRARGGGVQGEAHLAATLRSLDRAREKKRTRKQRDLSRI
jgi:hypothetical protein